jgi:hypothetical protein
MRMPGDREIRLVLANQPHQLGPVTGLADHLVPALLEQAAMPRA